MVNGRYTAWRNGLQPRKEVLGMNKIRKHLATFEKGEIQDIQKNRFQMMVDILQDLPEAIHPTNGIYNMGNHDDEFTHVGQGLLDSYTPRELLNLQKLIEQIELAIIKRDNVYPQVFVMTYMMNVFESYIMNKYHIGTKASEKAWPTAEEFNMTRLSMMKPWNNPSPEEMTATILEACRIEAQRTLQTFAHYGIPGFIMDGRGFIGVDSSTIPEEANMFLEFLDKNVNEMGAEKRTMISDGRTNEEQIADNITEVIANGGLETPEPWKDLTVDDDIDIDSDENDDEVVMW